jgi:hypothetical protein
VGARTAVPAGPPQIDVDVQSEGSAAERRLIYTARVRESSSGQPMPNADVSLYAWMPDGSDLRAQLSPTGTPGTYRGSVTVGPLTPGNPRIRINHSGRLFDVPVAR